MQFVVQSGAEPGKTYDLGATGQLSVGRQSANDIVVSDEQVSRRHAEIKAVVGGALVTDLGSSNGTFVNGARVSSPQMLKPNDTLQIGTTVLRLVDEDNATTTLPAGYEQPAPTMGNYNYAAANNYADPAAVAAPAVPNSYQQAAPSDNNYNQAGGGYGQQPAGYNQAGGYGQQSGGNQSASNYGQQVGGYDPNQAANFGGYNQGGQSPVGYNPNAYPPPANNSAYSATPTPAVPAKRRGLPLPLPVLIIIAVVVLAVIVGGILLVVLGKSSSSNASDIAAPLNSTKLNFGLDDIKKIPGSKVPADSSGISVVSYSSKDTPDSVINFYKDDLTKKGWKVTTTATDVNATKGDNTISISAIPISAQVVLDALEQSLPTLKGQVNVGETLILGAEGPSNKMTS